MKRITLLLLLFLFSLSKMVEAQSNVEKPKVPFKDRISVGGNIAFSFGTYTYIGVAPIVFYNVTPSWLVGLGGSYYYWKDTYYDVESSIYGGLALSRYIIFKGLFVEADFEANNLDAYTVDQLGQLHTQRMWVPSLLLGGGYAAPLGSNSAFYLSILYDVLQDPNSPYLGQPIIRGGFGFGF